MNKKIKTFGTWWKTSNSAFMLKNLLAAVLIGIVLLIILFSWLRRYTEHGIEVEIPDVTGMYIEEAQTILAAHNLQCQVVDSTYSKKVPLGTIVEQNPPALSHAKRNRTVYLIINASYRRQVPMPELHDISYRQAEATLRSLNLEIADIIYEPSEYKDLVLDVRQGGESLEAGSRVAEGSQVILVVGKGKGSELVATPNLLGKTITEARSLLLSQYLTLGGLSYDEPPTEETAELYIVYKQDPAPGRLIIEGSRVDVSLSTDMEKATMSHVEEQDDDFF